MRPRTATDLGLIIRDRRRKLGLDQKALADRVGVSRQWILAVEKGKPRAEIGLLLRTLEALGLQFDVDTGTGSAIVQGAPIPEVDIDAVVEKARGRKR